MTTCMSGTIGLGLVIMSLSAASVPAAGPAAKAAPVISKCDKPFVFGFGAWDRAKTAFPSKPDGLHVSAESGQGGAGLVAGTTMSLSDYAEWTPAMGAAVTDQNKAAALVLHLGDADGTRYQYRFDLRKLKPGQAEQVQAEYGASLAEPWKVEKPGKTPGLDLANITTVMVIGDWSGNAVDVVLSGIVLVPPTDELRAARAKLKELHAKEAERTRLEAEAKDKARRRLLEQGAPHPADGPDVRRVAAVAGDVLCLSIQEKQFVPVPQAPYEPKEGDQVKHVGKESVLVVEDGKVQEALKDVVVTRKEGGKDVKIGHLAINVKRLKPEDKSVGQDLTTDTVDAPAAYRISSADDPAWKEPAAPVQVWWKRKPDAYRSMAFGVEVFLKLPKPLAEGKTYRIEFAGVNFRQASVEYRHDPSGIRSVAVHVSAIGFRPDDPFKRAFLSVWLGTGGALRYGKGLKFHLLDDATGKSVLDGEVKPLVAADGPETFKAGRNYSKTDVLGMDFSAFSTPGRYRVYVQGVGCSYPFTIAADAWTQAFRLSMKGLLHQRSGIELGPPLTDYVRPRNMHPADGVKVFASAASEIDGGSQDGIFQALSKGRTDRLLPDAWGGHMDAGDWDRNTAHPAAMWWLVDLYELLPDRIGPVKLALPPAEAGNAIPDILDEVLWNLDLYRRLQAPDVGVGGGIESTSHPRAGEASWQESLMLSAFAPDPRASLVYAATAAKLARNLARIDKKLADTYAASAREAWTWAIAHSQEFLARIDDEKKRAKLADTFRDRRNLAALELWLLTGEAPFHDEFRASTILTDEKVHIYEQIKAVLVYARLPDGKGDAALRQAARAKVLAAADNCLRFAQGNAFGVTMGVANLPPMGFVGYLSTPETSLGPVLPQAWLLTGDAKYLAGAVRACQFAAGANPDNRALTTGLGPNPVRFPLHIDSWVTAQPAPAGITVYGISDPAENYDFDGWAHTWFLQKMVPPSRSWPTHESYWDIYTVPSTNEFTIHQTIIPTAYYWGFLAARP